MISKIKKDILPALKGGKPVRDKFLIFGSPRIEKEEIKEVLDTLKSGWLSTGPKVERFERMFRDYIGSRYALALNSCTAGLHLAMLVAGIKPGDEVITTPLTFAATANSILHCRGKPVFVDIDRKTMNIDASKISKSISTRTKAIIPVHFAGRPCQMNEIMLLAKKNKLHVIEDAAHAIEAVYKGKKIGTIADMTVFSFYVTKNITTGEGGIVTTNRADWADKIQIYGLHGLSKGAWRRYSDDGFKHYQVIYPGFKYNMMDIQASLGIHQLKRVESYLLRREEIWRRYNDALCDLPLVMPEETPTDIKHARHLYTILLDLDKLKVGRDVIQNALHKENIGTGIHFTALHLYPYYRKKFGYRRGDFPNAEFISERTISLPLSAKLKDKDVVDVITAVRKVLRFFAKRNLF